MDLYRGDIIYELGWGLSSIEDIFLLKKEDLKTFLLNSRTVIILSFTLEETAQVPEKGLGHWHRFLASGGLTSGVRISHGPSFTAVFGDTDPITPDRKHTRHFFSCSDQAKAVLMLREPQPLPNFIKRSNSISKKLRVQLLTILF